MPAGRLRRSIAPARLVAAGTARWVGASLAFGERRQRRRDEALLRTAEDVTRTLGDMKGAAMKMGQVVSMLTGAVPGTLAETMSSLQSQAPILEPTVRFTPELAGEMVRRNSATTGPGGEVNRWLNVPAGMVFLTRINFGLAGLFASLEAEGPWQGIIREYVYGVPPATRLGELSLASTSGVSV